jgi:hypothetical protein
VSVTPLNAYRPDASTHLREPWDGIHCEGVDMSTTSRTPAQIRDLKLLCVGRIECPSLRRCGRYVINNLTDRDDSDDVAAGMTREERVEVRAVLEARRANRECAA